MTIKVSNRKVHKYLAVNTKRDIYRQTRAPDVALFAHFSRLHWWQPLVLISCTTKLLSFSHVAQSFIFQRPPSPHTHT